MNLIPEIEIGKKYLWRVKPIEDVCKKCGLITGEASNGHINIVLILDPSYSSRYQCERCGFVSEIEQGWYCCQVLSGDGNVGVVAVVPYTLLEEIPEEVEHGQ